MKQTGAWIGFVIGAAALILQLSLTVPLRLAQGDNIGGALVFYFSFFTILSNTALVLTYAAELWNVALLAPLATPRFRAMLAAAIALVGIFYHLILAETWDPEGLGLICDVTLHYVTPTLYVLWWIFTARHGQLGWTDVPAMLVPPTLYLIYVMIRGALTGLYPYPILEIDRLGFGVVVLNVLAVLAGLAALACLVVALDQIIGKQARQ